VWQSASVRGGKRPDGRRWRDAVLRPTPMNLALAVVLFLLPWAVALVNVRHHHLDSGAVGLAATFSLGLPALWLAVAAYLEAGRSAQVSELTLADVADQLAIAVGAQWNAENAVRHLNEPYPLPVSWVAADPDLTVGWDSLFNLATSGADWPQPPPVKTWAAGPDDLAGKGQELANVLARVPTGRLIVLGEPGSGKTMLMVRLVLDLLKNREKGKPVPILASIASWNPAEQHLRDWLRAQLLIDHPGLADPPPLGVKARTQAEALLGSRLILPVLDGLDEIPEEVRGSAIGQINGALLPGERLVVTCRSKEYRDAIRPKGGRELKPVEAAAAIKLCPLDLATVHDYLRNDAPGPDTRARWDRVFNRLGKKAPAREALTTPLMVGLARAIYNSSGEPSVARPDPIELRNRALADRRAVESLLLDAFSPAAYRDAPPGGWNAQDAERWFAFLARHLEHEIRSPDLAWWQLSRAVSRFALAASAAGAVAGAEFCIVFAIGVSETLAVGPSFGTPAEALPIAAFFGALVGALVGIVVVMRRKSPTPVRGIVRGIRWQSPERRNLVSAAKVGVIMGSLLWLVTLSIVFFQHEGVDVVGAVVVFMRLVLAGAAVGIVLKFAGSWARLPLNLSSATSPSVVLAGDRRTAIAISVGLAAFFGVILGVTVGIAKGVITGIAGRIGFGILTGAWEGVAAGVILSFAVTAWPLYGTARTWLALRHRLPWRLMSFLEDAHRRGVLRQEGAIYQFRHIELQHRLANTSGKIGSYRDVQDANGDKYRITLMRIIDPAQADQYATPDNGRRFVGAVFRIRALSGSPKDEGPNNDAAVIGSNGQAYSADLKGIAGYTNFGNAVIHLAQGETVMGSVTFQVPEPVEVAKVQWTPTGLGSIVQWDLRHYRG
jgi:hypothetical protein